MTWNTFSESLNVLCGETKELKKLVTVINAIISFKMIQMAW